VERAPRGHRGVARSYCPGSRSIGRSAKVARSPPGEIIGSGQDGHNHELCWLLKEVIKVRITFV
jgi:hypothetical protein